jgi:hypothetical protein
MNLMKIGKNIISLDDILCIYNNHVQFKNNKSIYLGSKVPPELYELDGFVTCKYDIYVISLNIKEIISVSVSGSLKIEFRNSNGIDRNIPEKFKNIILETISEHNSCTSIEEIEI